MGVRKTIQFASIDKLMLDPTNPRLGRDRASKDVPQEQVLEWMASWTLDELAVSFLENGFWPQEALIVVEEKLYGKSHQVVVEGNRRLAALRLLRDAVEGRPRSPKWAAIAASKDVPEGLFTDVPYLVVDSRKDVEAFLGFRHVTGIKEWRPAEKAAYIARLIDDAGMSYDQVRRAIGSKAATVRQHYIAYRLLRQLEDTAENISFRHLEKRFSVMYLSLRAKGVQDYLRLDIQADPEAARNPVPRGRLKNLSRYAVWLFGEEGPDGAPPLFTDSRRVDDFGRILENKKAVEYLERTERPKFDVALRTAGGDEAELVRLAKVAADNIELALTTAHLYTKSRKLRLAIRRLGADALQLLKVFPDIREELVEGGA